MAKDRKGSGAAGYSVVILLLIVGLAVGWFSIFGGPYQKAVPERFHAGRWQAADAGGNRRCAMLWDLTERVGIVGKTRAELERMLGPAEDEDDDPTVSHWRLCPSFMDIYILEVGWRGDRAVSARVRDT